MSYSNPMTVTFNAAKDFASTDVTYALAAPLGCSRGRLRDIQVGVTTNCAGATTKPIVNLGKAAALTKYASLNLATTAAGAVIKAASFTEDDIDDTTLLLTLVAATGAGAAGVGVVSVTIDWF